MPGVLPTLPAMTLNANVLRRSWSEWISNDLDPTTPGWLQWLWTLVFALVVALGFTLIGMASGAGRNPGLWFDGGVWWRWYRVNFAVTLTIAVLIHLMFLVIIPLVGKARIRSFSDRGRAAFFTAIPLSGVVLGWPLGVWLVGQDAAKWIRTMNTGEFVSSAVLALLVSVVIFLVFNARAQQALAEKRAVESQLRLLQAQMEPHFLFNTLANVLTLIDIEPQRAKQMLESFTDYLRATLDGLRQAGGSAGGELDLAEAYLRLLQLRMEDRLRFDIDADAAARRAALPPLMLQPLVENAIHHGLEPKLEGGTLSVRARVQGNELQLTVEDDGLGPDAPPRHAAGKPGGNGMALDNIRQRLQALYGDAASLTIEPLQPGTRATLRLPFSTCPTLR